MMKREDWLKERKKGIGGSDISAIIGVNPFKTAYDVWLDKTGRSKEVEDESLKAVFDRGHRLEPVIADWYNDNVETAVIPPEEDEIIWDGICFGTRDRVIKDGTLEIKSTAMRVSEIPYYWFCQPQWYSGIAKVDRCVIAWIDSSMSFKHEEFSFNKEFFSYMKEEAGRFWNDHVLKDIPPEPQNEKDILSMFPMRDEGESIECSNELFNIYTELSDTKDCISNLKKQEDRLKDQIKLTMKGAEALKKGEETLISWKYSKSKQVFNETLFKEENPDLWAKYLLSKAGSRRFLIK